MSHSAKDHALEAVRLAHKSLLTCLKSLSHSLKNAHGEARCYELPRVRDDLEGPSATLYGASDSSPGRQATIAGVEPAPRRGRVVNKADLGGEPPSLYSRPVKVIELHNERALAAALRVYNAVQRAKGQSPHDSDRVAGVICAPGPTVAEDIKAVNDAKDELQAAIQNLPADKRTRSDRYQLLGAYAPELAHLHLAQAYRHIIYVQDSIERLTFGWARNLRSVQREKITDVIADLARRNQFDDEGIIEGRLRRLQEEDGVQWLARVAPIAPAPICNYIAVDRNPKSKSKKRGQERQFRVQAAMPIVLAQPQLPDLVPLEDFDPAAPPSERPHKPRRLQDKPLFRIGSTRIAYYRYLE